MESRQVFAVRISAELSTRPTYCINHSKRWMAFSFRKVMFKVEISIIWNIMLIHVLIKDIQWRAKWLSGKKLNDVAFSSNVKRYIDTRWNYLIHFKFLQMSSLVEWLTNQTSRLPPFSSHPPSTPPHSPLHPCCVWPNAMESNCGQKTTFNDYFIPECWGERSHRQVISTKEGDLFFRHTIFRQQRILLTWLRLKQQNK